MKTSDVTRQISGAARLSFTGVNLAQISPEHGARFSPNLFSFLNCIRNRKGFAPRARVFTTTDLTMWIGFFDDTNMFVGAKLMRALCLGSETEITCPINLGPLTEVEDFWQRYLLVGRCAVDPKHNSSFVSDESRWSVSGSVRTCVWCSDFSQKIFTYLAEPEVKTCWVPFKV